MLLKKIKMQEKPHIDRSSAPDPAHTSNWWTGQDTRCSTNNSPTLSALQASSFGPLASLYAAQLYAKPGSATVYRAYRTETSILFTSFNTIRIIIVYY